MNPDLINVPVWTRDPLDEIRVGARRRPTIVLDDDPTGTQTLAGVDVVLGWDIDRIHTHVRRQGHAVVLLNTRSLDAPRAHAQMLEAGRAIRSDWEAASVIIRGDSTLRGHFPTDVRALDEGLGRNAATLLVPYFGDAGRITVDDVHLVLVDGTYVPVGETEYARDPTFGFRASDLREWITERGATSGAIHSLGLADVRTGGPAWVRERIQGLRGGDIMIGNAATDRDVEVLVAGALEAELAGSALIARTAASYVRARLGLRPADPIDPKSLGPGRPGLIVVGSFVDVSSRQLETLLAHGQVDPLPIDVDDVIAGRADPSSIANRIDRSLESGRSIVAYTSRHVVVDPDPARSREIGRRVSAMLVEVVRHVRVRPRWIVAKGGITSHDIAVEAIGMQEATILGPIVPGIPVWRAPSACRWPDITYVVFPGNVGADDTLLQVTRSLAGGEA